MVVLPNMETKGREKDSASLLLPTMKSNCVPCVLNNAHACCLCISAEHVFTAGEELRF